MIAHTARAFYARDDVFVLKAHVKRKSLFSLTWFVAAPVSNVIMTFRIAHRGIDNCSIHLPDSPSIIQLRQTKLRRKDALYRRLLYPVL